MTIISPALVTSPCSITLGLNTAPRENTKIDWKALSTSTQGWLTLGREKLTSISLCAALTRCVSCWLWWMAGVHTGHSLPAHGSSASLCFFSSAAATQGCAHLWTKVGWSVFWIIFYWSIPWPWSIPGPSNQRLFCTFIISTIKLVQGVPKKTVIHVWPHFS